MVIDYEAARAAFLDCTAYWAPEWVNDPDMFAKMLDDVLVAAGIDDEADDEPTEDDDPTPYCMRCGSKTYAGCHCGPRADND